MTCGACGARRRCGRFALVLGAAGEARRMRVCVDCERRGWLMVTRIGPAANAATSPRSSAQQQGGGEPVDPSELRAFAEKLKSRTAAGALPAPRADIDG